MDGARELQHEADGGWIRRVSSALVARGRRLVAQTTLGVCADVEFIGCEDSRPRGRE
jgi:hypothetical protein